MASPFAFRGAERLASLAVSVLVLGTDGTGYRSLRSLDFGE
jgi:hypothetical protein